MLAILRDLIVAPGVVSLGLRQLHLLDLGRRVLLDQRRHRMLKQMADCFQP